MKSSMATWKQFSAFGKACAVSLTLAAVVFVFGCRATKEVTERNRKEAAVMASEAQFAVTVKDWARAEGLYVKAVAIVPAGNYYLGLGGARKHLNNRAGAKAAYESALKAYEAEAVRHSTSPDPWMKQVLVLGLLGRKSECQALLAKAAKRLPNDPKIRALQDPKELERMFAAPEFKDMAL